MAVTEKTLAQHNKMLTETHFPIHEIIQMIYQTPDSFEFLIDAAKIEEKTDTDKPSTNNTPNIARVNLAKFLLCSAVFLKDFEEIQKRKADGIKILNRVMAEKDPLSTPDANALYAFCLLEGNGVEKDRNQAVTLLQQTLELYPFHPYTIGLLGECFFIGLGVNADKQRAYNLFVKEKNCAAYNKQPPSVQQQSAHAVSMQAYCLERPEGLPSQNIQEALNLYLSIENKNDLFALLRIAYFHEEGLYNSHKQGTSLTQPKKDLKQAYEFYKKAAELGSHEGLIKMIRYCLGVDQIKGIEPNPKEASRFVNIFLRFDTPTFIERLRQLCNDILAIEQKKEDVNNQLPASQRTSKNNLACDFAFQTLIVLSKREPVQTNLLLAEIFFVGFGIGKQSIDLKKSEARARLAASHGNIEGNCYLGKIYEDRKEFELAAAEYSIAHAAGHVVSTYYLSLLMLNHFNDRAEGLRLLEEARDQGYQPARDKLASIRANVSADTASKADTKSSSDTKINSDKKTNMENPPYFLLMHLHYLNATPPNTFTVHTALDTSLDTALAAHTSPNPDTPHTETLDGTNNVNMDVHANVHSNSDLTQTESFSP